MKKIASLIIGIATLSILSACGNQEVQLPSNAPSLKTYSSEKYSFQYPEDYTITLPTKSFPVLAIEKAKNKRIEIFQMKDFGDRPWGFEGNESQEEIDGYVPKELLTSGTGENKYDVWLFYSKNDTATQKEEKEIFNSIVIPKSSTYTSAKFGFSFEIPEGFFKGEIPSYKKFPYYPSFEEANSKKEKIAPAEYVIVSKISEREEFAKEIEKLKASGVNSFDGPVFSDTSIYIFEKPYTEMIKYIDSMTQPEEKTAWEEIQIGNQKGKTLTISPYGYTKITAIDKQKYTIIIEEENCCSGKEKDFPVTPAILATLKIK